MVLPPVAEHAAHALSSVPIELLVGPEATAVTHSVLSAQLVLFKEYGYLHLTGTMLEEALQQGASEGVPGTYTDLEGATAEEKKAKAAKTKTGEEKALQKALAASLRRSPGSPASAHFCSPSRSARPLSPRTASPWIDRG